MWKYNNTNDMYSPELYHSADELYHYGIPGMRWRYRKARLQEYNNNLVRTRRNKANQNVTKLKNKGASNKHIEKAKTKADKINRSKYGQTRGQILAKGLVRNIGANILGGTAYKIAKEAGADKLAKYIGIGTGAYQTANTLKTGYKIITNYDKPTKKSGTRMSYR